MKKLIILLTISFLSIFYLQAKSSKTLTGTVKAADSQEPLAFAMIKNESSKKILATDENGVFKLTFSLKKEILSIASIGYQSIQLELSDTDTAVTILLEPMALNLGEVNVYASKSSMQASSLESLKNIETYSLAGTTKDIFRSVQMLPGVSSNNAASAQFNVRGGTYDENLMLINGIEVAEPYHIKVFPMASVGIFNIDMVQRIDFSSGGFSAEYGDALSSVLNVDYRKANNDSISGRINLGMIDLGVQVELPVSKKSSLLVAGRQSYLDPVVKMVDPGEKVSIKYYDFQAKYDYKINARNEISVLGIFSQDYDKVGPETNLKNYTFPGKFGKDPMTVHQTEKSYFLLDSKYNDILAAIMSKHQIGSKIQLNTEFSFYHEKENTPQTETDTITNSFSVAKLFYRNYYFWESIKDYDLTNYEFKLSAKYLFAPNHSLKIGGNARISEYDYQNKRTRFWDIYNNTDKYPDTSKYISKPNNPEDNSTYYFNAKGVKASGYASYSWQINSRLSLTLGVRADYFSLNKQTTVSPRFNASYKLNDFWKTTFAWGIFEKSPLMKQLKYSSATSDNTKSQQATHYIAGIERKNNEFTFKTEVYYKKYNHLLSTWRSSNGEVFYVSLENNFNGYAAGIDFEYIITKEKYNIWFIYSLCSSKERPNGTDSYYSRYTDQKQTISSLLVYKMKNRKQFDIKVTYGSGYAYQTRYFDVKQNQWILNNPVQTKHLPYYLTVDLRFKKDFLIRSNPLQVYVDVMNVFNRNNVIGHRYRQSYNEHSEEEFSFLGILPTFGVLYDF